VGALPGAKPNACDQLFFQRLYECFKKQQVRVEKIIAKVLACSGVVYYYITKSPKHLDDGLNRNFWIGDDHEHLNLNQTRSPCSRVDGQQRNHGWHGLLVQCAAAGAHGSDVAGQCYRALNERRGLSNLA
jgi:hypothetical protein